MLPTRVDKTALLRHLFELGCRYSARVISYDKMLGHLQGVPNHPLGCSVNPGRHTVSAKLEFQD